MQKNRFWRHVTENTNVEVRGGGVMGFNKEEDSAAMLVDAGGISATRVVGGVGVGLGCEMKGSA